VALTLSACSVGSSGNEKSSDTAISHIHGVDIAPSGGKLYVATHDGIYTPDKNGSPQLVGDSRDDFMGFTVADDGTFLASGHPAPGRDAPGNLGLIKSTDTGETWKSRSLSGEVDFHALDYAHDTIYGSDSTNGMLHVSKDGETWERRGELQAVDIAVSPDEADTILATPQSGVARSTDGGETFSTGEEPVMAFISCTKRLAVTR
jgi:hypothetical protein